MENDHIKIFHGLDVHGPKKDSARSLGDLDSHAEASERFSLKKGN